MSNTNAMQGSVTEFGAHLIKNLEWASLPESVSWMPATLAWYALFSMFIIMILGRLTARYFQWLKGLYLRQADDLLEEYRSSSPDKIAQLVKRVANHRWPESKVGLMNVDQFSYFLVQQQGESALSSSCCVALFMAMYNPDETVSELHILEVKRWIGALNV